MPASRHPAASRGSAPTGSRPPEWMRRFRRSLLAAGAGAPTTTDTTGAAAWLQRSGNRHNSK